MKPTILALSIGLCAAATPAQMSGLYVIDPATPGAFASFTEAVNAMFVGGVNGPVELLVAPGSYNESILFPPISGASASNTITFKPLVGPGTVEITGSAGDIFAMLAVPFQRNRSVIWDGISFMGAPGHAISATTFVEDLEIKNCYFASGHQSSAAGEYRHCVLISQNSGNEIGWRVHHNTITLSTYTNRTSYGIYLSNGGGWEIHNNTIDLNGGDHGLYMINNNGSLDQVYNNLFIGSLHQTSSSSANAQCAIRADISNYNNQISHNTFALSLTSSQCCIATSATTSYQNYIYGNVFFITGGTAIVTAESSGAPRPFESDGNVFFCPGGNIGRVNASSSGTAYATLAAWQAAVGKDAASIEADPQLNDPFGTPPDLRPTPTSPVVGVAVNTPAWVVDDFAGRLRDAAPDAGAYESTSFALYGQACAGTGGVAPMLGSSGVAQLGSASFAIELTQAPANAITVIFGGLQPLDLDLGGCQLLASPDATALLISDPGGAATFAFPLPFDPSLSGADLFFQWAVSDGGSVSPIGLTFTEGGALQL